MIRGGLLVMVCFLFFVSVLALTSVYVVENSLEYNNIKVELVPVITELADSQFDLSNNVAENYMNYSDLCLNSSEIVFEYEGEAKNISCSLITQGPEAIKEKVIEDMVEEIYYKEYNCNLLDCNSDGKNPFFLVSEHTKNYFGSWLVKSFILSIVLFVLLLFIVESISNGFLIAGILVLVSGVFMRVSTGAILKMIFSPITQGLGIDILKVFGFLLNSLGSVFIKTLILGIALIVLGILWKIFALGFKIKGFFDKFSSNKKEDKKKE